MTSHFAVTSRPASRPRDLDAIYEMTAASPHDALHLADLPWRLASPAAQDPARTRLWEASDGTLHAWAILQFPWHCLDYRVRSGPDRERIEASVLQWAVERLGEEANGRGEELPFYVSTRAGDTDRIAAAGRVEFQFDGWSYLHLVLDLAEQMPEAAPPRGFAIRPLAGESEVAAYVAAHRAAFGSANMTAAWRRQTLREPRYQPELDLVAVATDGTVAAFCVGWATPPLVALGGARVAQIEPLGVRPEYQRLGLGRALLLEVIHRARAVGAKRIEVDAESYNEASRGVYGSIGFCTAFEAPFLRRTFGPPLSTP